MNFLKFLPNDVLRNIFEMDNTYKLKFTNDIIKTKSIERNHLKKMCNEQKACITFDIYYDSMYDYDYDTYYGFMFNDDVININSLCNPETRYYDDISLNYQLFKEFTDDEKRFYQNYDYTVYGKIML